jgi:DNA-binding NarL/FixJ family response regulator
MERLSVLVVDKDPTVRAALARLLEGRGNNVVVVPTRSRGFEVLDAMHFDLLILDDPAQERCYRMVWLTEDVPDVRVELLDINAENLAAQLESVLHVTEPLGAQPVDLTSSGVTEFDSAETAA